MLHAGVIIGSVALILTTVTQCQGATIPLLSQKNGEPTDVNEFLEFTSVRRISGDHLCGGVLIDADSLLTVASCLFDSSGRPFNIDELRVVIGSTAQRDINRIFIHPDFEIEKDSNNIALLHLSPSSTSSTFAANAINTAIEPVSQYQKCTLVGWLNEDNTMTFTKRKMDVTLESENVTDSFNTVLPVECQPVVASALICNNMVNGFLSTLCPTSSVPKLTFTDVTVFNNWIDQILRCELKPEIGGCQMTTTTTTMKSTTEMESGSTVVYNENMMMMEHTNEFVTTLSTDSTVAMAVTPVPEPNDQAEVGHAYHEHEHIHEYEHNQHTHENYHTPPEQDRVEAPRASSAVKINPVYSFLIAIPCIALVKLSF